MIDAALALAERGWHVFPCKASKAPAIAGGLNNATVDPDQIRTWWDAMPDSLVGVNCGASGLAVVDVDDWDGYAQACDEHGDLPVTLTAQTPSGGAHYYFAGDIKSTVSKVGPRVDTRGRGGYVIVPPSTGYEWVHKMRPAPLPDAWQLAADPPRPERPEITLSPTGEANTKWGQRILDGEIARVATAPEGTRNATLFEAACNIFEAVKGGHIPEAEARGSLESVALRIGLDRDEIDEVLGNAWERTAARHPEPRPEPSSVSAPAPTARDYEDRSYEDDEYEGLSLSQLQDMPPPRWVLEPIIPEGLTFLVGPPKVGKSFVALDWAATAAAHGANVMYFAGEGVSGFAQRVASWAATHPTADLSRFSVVPKAPQLLSQPDVARLHRTIARRSIDLMVIDTWSRATRGADENSHTDMSSAIGVHDDLREQHGLSTLVVHHTNAGGEKPRGHTSLVGAVEALWQVREEDVLARTLTVHAREMKDAALPAPLYFQIREQHGAAVLHPSVYQRYGRL